MNKDFNYFLLVCFLICLGIIVTIPFLNYLECHAKAEKQGLECSWGGFQGCMVKIDGKWIDYGRLRIMD